MSEIRAGADRGSSSTMPRRKSAFSGNRPWHGVKANEISPRSPRYHLQRTHIPGGGGGDARQSASTSVCGARSRCTHGIPGHRNPAVTNSSMFVEARRALERRLNFATCTPDRDAFPGAKPAGRAPGSRTTADAAPVGLVRDGPLDAHETLDDNGAYSGPQGPDIHPGGGQSPPQIR